LGPEELTRHLIATLGGRYSSELGIDVDRGLDQVERWALAATLFGARISTTIALHTYRLLDAAGASTVSSAARLPREELEALLDAGGYTRFDFRTADGVHQLAPLVHLRALRRWSRLTATVALARELDALPGWVPVTVRIFPRELRGTWPGANPPLDPRAVWAAHHLGLLAPSTRSPIEQVHRLATRAGLDRRDVEVGLVRLSLCHARKTQECTGGTHCQLLRPRQVGERRSALEIAAEVNDDGSGPSTLNHSSQQEEADSDERNARVGDGDASRER